MTATAEAHSREHPLVVQWVETFKAIAAVSGLIWGLALAGCLIVALSPLSVGGWHYAQFAVLGIVIPVTVLVWRKIWQGKPLPLSFMTPILVIVFFGPFGILYAAGSIPMVVLHLRIQLLRRYKNPKWLFPVIFCTFAYGGLGYAISTSFYGSVYARLAEWASQYGAHFPKNLDVSIKWYFTASLLLLMVALGAEAFICTWWWEHYLDNFDLIVDDVEKRRLWLVADLNELLHDGVLRVLETAAAGRSLNDADRSLVAHFSQVIRRGLLDDRTPRTTAHFINAVRSICAELGLVPSVQDVPYGEPPGDVLDVFRRALSALLGNIRQHSGVDEVAISVLAGTESLSVTIRDDGCGFDPEGVAWSPHTERQVFQALVELTPAGEAAFNTMSGEGTTWTLNWPAVERDRQ
jgi:hypothetical protein